VRRRQNNGTYRIRVKTKEMNMPGKLRTLLGILTVATLSFLLGPSASAEGPEGGLPYRVGEGVSRPEKISGFPPVYTEVARRARVTGIVIVEAIIDEQGNVTNARVLKGLPMGLDKAAVEAIQTWKFKPAVFEGRPVSVYYTLTVNFQVDDSPQFGPRFREFLRTNPDFAGLVQSKRYGEATALLDRRAAERTGDDDTPLARCYLLLEQGRLDDALEGAPSDRGADPYEMFTAIGAYAWSKAVNDRAMTPATRTATVELGLRATTMAIAAKADGLEAMAGKVDLLRAKIMWTLDPEERQALTAEANELQALAASLQPKAREP